jgi:glutathione peroxidase
MEDSEAMAMLEQQSIFDLNMRLLDGRSISLDQFGDKVLLAVNVASSCGFTPQYAGLQALYERYGPENFAVLGFPCNQFLFQERGSASDIQRFCSGKYAVTFPLFAKLKVKGGGAAPLYNIMSRHPDDDGKAGNVSWNFEKFLLDHDGHVMRRFRSKVRPDDPKVISAIEVLLAA